MDPRPINRIKEISGSQKISTIKNNKDLDIICLLQCV